MFRGDIMKIRLIAGALAIAIISAPALAAKPKNSVTVVLLLWRMVLRLKLQL